MLFSESWDGTASAVGLACRSGDVKVLNKLLKKGKAVDRMDNRGWRPIHEAAYGSHTNCLEILINNGNSDLNWQTHEGETPLIMSLVNNNKNAALMLLNAGADPNVATIFNQSPLHVAVEKNMIECVGALLQAGAKVNCPDYSEETPLHLAAKSNFLEVARLLLNGGASLGEVDEFGRTPIFLAAGNGSVDCLKLFIERIKSAKESISLIEKATNDGVTPLMIAAQNGHIECLSLLIEEGADLSHLADDGTTALNLALYCGQPECVKLLCPLTRKELKIRICDGEYTCLLHLALKAKKCQHELLLQLLDDGLDLSTCVTPLMKLKYSEWLTFYSPLIQHYWGYIHDCFDVRQIYLSLLSSAVEANQPECVLEIIRRGGEVNPTSQRIMHPLVIALIFDRLEMVKLLLDNGANPNYRFDGLERPVILELAYPNIKALIVILKRGGDLRLGFPQRSQSLALVNLFSLEHLHCLKYIINRFMSISTDLFYDVDYAEKYNCYRIVLEERSCRNSCTKSMWQLSWSTADEDGAHDDCIKLISGINSTSLQHLCRIKIVQTVLEANNWAPLQDYLKRLPIPPVLVNYLLYEDVQ